MLELLSLFFLKKNKKNVLIGKILNEIEYGMYAFPGGHIEFGESFIEIAVREVKEETNLDIKNVKLIKIINCINKKTTIIISFKY